MLANHGGISFYSAQCCQFINTAGEGEILILTIVTLGVTITEEIRMYAAQDAINLTSKLVFIILTSLAISVGFVCINTSVLAIVGVKNIMMSLFGNPGRDVLAYLSTFLTSHRGLEQEGGLTKYSKRSDTVRVAGATTLTTPHVWTNHRIQVF